MGINFHPAAASAYVHTHPPTQTHTPSHTKTHTYLHQRCACLWKAIEWSFRLGSIVPCRRAMKANAGPSTDSDHHEGYRSQRGTGEDGSRARRGGGKEGWKGEKACDQYTAKLISLNRMKYPSNNCQSDKIMYFFLRVGFGITAQSVEEKLPSNRRRDC